MLIKSFGVGIAIAALSTGAFAQDARATLGQAFGAVSRADGPEARRLLAQMPVDGLSPGQSELRTCMMQRLDPLAPSADREGDAPISLRLLDIFRRYWTEAAGSPDNRAEAELRLYAATARVLDLEAGTDNEQISERMMERIEGEGFHALGGRTGALLDLYLWSEQETREVEVSLPEGTYPVTVFLMSDFQSMGWANWLNCGRSGTGGWVKPEGIYAVVSAYESLDDETFAVNFIAHETQHFADNAIWPGLPGHELEYRAKLTELAMAETTLATILERFEQNQGDDETASHSFANRRVLHALRARLGLEEGADLTSVPPSVLKEAARQELFADTHRRQEH